MVILLAVFPIVFLLSSLTYEIPGEPSGLDEITTDIVQSEILSVTFGTLYSAMVGVMWGVGALVVLLSLLFDCHMWCNVMFVRGHRIQERNRDKFKIALFTAMALGVQIPPAVNCFLSFIHLYNFDAPQTAIAYYLSKHIDQRKWDKVQIWFDCCGVNNYTYWQSRHEAVPDSCCKDYSPGCGNFTSLYQINERGCVPNVTAHVNEQIRCHTIHDQANFALAFSDLIIGCFVILSWAWLKSRAHLKCLSRNGENQDDELNDDGDIEANHEEQPLIQNAALLEDDNDNINTDDAIIDIEDNNVDNDGDGDSEVNRVIEVEDVLDVHQNNAEDDDDELLE